MNPSDLLKDRNPDLLKEWDYEANASIDLGTLQANSSKYAFWICRINPNHKWETKVRLRAIDGHGCLYCSGKKVLREESFAAKHPELLLQWDYERNKSLDPWTLTEYSHKKIHWKCEKNPAHIWSNTTASRVRYNSGCPHCGRLNKQHRIKGDKSLIKNFPRIAREWHPTKNLPLIATQVTYGSSKRVWWQCSKNKAHVWDATVTSRTSTTGGKCPFCTGMEVSDQNSLTSLYPDVAKEWHPTRNSPLSPDKVKKASGKKVCWKCSRDPSHEWEAVIRNRTLLGSGCPKCDAETKYFRISNSQFLTAGTGTNYHTVFASNIHNLDQILKKSGLNGTRLEQPFLRMTYAAAITALEAYLSDAFYDSVMGSDVLLNRLFTTDPEFRTKKFSIEETMAWADSYKEKAAEHLQKIAWHNLARVSHLYKNVLNIEIFIDNEQLHRAIAIRHDIVHRNGRTKLGGSISLRHSDVENILRTIAAFVATVDRQINNRIEPKESISD